MVVICDTSANVWAIPLRSKDEAYEEIGNLIDEINLAEAVYTGQRVVFAGPER